MWFKDLFRSLHDEWSIEVDARLSLSLTSKDLKCRIPLEQFLKTDFLGDLLPKTPLYIVDGDTFRRAISRDEVIHIRFNDIIGNEDFNGLREVYERLIRELLESGPINTRVGIPTISDKLLDEVSNLYNLLSEYSRELDERSFPGFYTATYMERGGGDPTLVALDIKTPCILISPDKIMEVAGNDETLFTEVFKAVYILNLSRSILDSGCRYGNRYIHVVYERGLSTYLSLTLSKNIHLNSELPAYVKMLNSILPPEHSIYGLFEADETIYVRPMFKRIFDFGYERKASLASIIATYFIVPNALPLLTSIIDFHRGNTFHRYDKPETWIWIWRSLKASRLRDKHPILDLITFIPILLYYKKYFYTL